MKALVGSLDRDTMVKACKRFRSRIEAVLTNNNHFIEQLDSQFPSLLIFFTLIKSDDFQLCCVIFKKYFENSGFIAATLYFGT
jgi:hypothetical protein